MRRGEWENTPTCTAAQYTAVLSDDWMSCMFMVADKSGAFHAQG